MLKIGVILGASLFAVGAIVAFISYDPAVELFPGRTETLSKAQRTVAVWDKAGSGREPNWINPEPALPTYPNPIFSSERTGRYH